MIVIDSGLGGLAVARALRAQAPAAPFAYLADTAAFPYGNRSADAIAARAVQLVRALEKQMALSTLVLACNTLSTLALAHLRAHFPQYHFVGTVPAVKVAAAQAKRFTLLATPNTAQSDYSKQLIGEFAAHCTVDSYGAPNLARLAEQHLLGEPVAAEAFAAELRPAFHDDTHGKTEAIVLGCTHYPLILPQLKAAAPWDVAWIDSSDAIARRALSRPPSDGGDVPPLAFVSGAADVARYTSIFTQEGFEAIRLLGVSD